MVFEEVSKDLESVKFGHVFITDLNTKKSNHIILYNNQLNEQLVYAVTPFEYQAVLKFIKINTLPLVNRFDSTVAEAIFDLE